MRREVRTTSVSDLVSHLDDVVQILDLTNLDGRLALGIQRVKRGQIGAAFVDGYRLGRAVLTDCLFEEAPGSSLVPLGPEQKIDGVARLIHGPVKILPRALDLDIGFINPPALADRTLVLAKRLSNSGTSLTTQRCTVE